MTEIAVLVHEHSMSPQEAKSLTVRERDYWLAIAYFWLEMRTRG
jgi:hypothetical protein